MSPAREFVQKFLENEKIVIVDPSASFGQSISASLIELGAKADNIFYVKKYSDAVEKINVHMPRILFTEYYLGENIGFSLIPVQQKYFDDADKVAVVATHNASAASIAEAAEEYVDAYMLKPFSMGEFQARIIQLINSKLNPTDYAKRIRDGKILLKAKDFDKAAEEFEKAAKMDPKPSLAHYYLGHTKYLQNKFGEALREFKSGLNIQPLHYKCLLGEFDSLFEQKKYDEAYKLVPTIKKNFPISPKRLGNIFISAVFSHNYQDISSYYQLYQNLEYRPTELSKIFSMALLTAGKFNIKKNDIEHADECFNLGVTITGSDANYIGTIIRELLKLKDADRASFYLSKFPHGAIGGKEYSALSFLIDQYVLMPHDVIEKGKKLVSSGYADAECYRTIVKMLVNNGKIVMAEDIATKAVRDYPDLRTELYSIIESKNKSQST